MLIARLVCSRWTMAVALLVASRAANAQQIMAAGKPAQLDIRAAGPSSIRITVRPLDVPEQTLNTPALAQRKYAAPAISVRTLKQPMQKFIGSMLVEVRPDPLTIHITDTKGEPVQHLVFEHDGTLSFKLDDQPVLGMGEGGPLPARGTNWREQPIEFDRRGRLFQMQPRWQSNAYGSRNPVAMLVGTAGWALFVPTPWGEVDLRNANHGTLIPWQPTDSDRVVQTEKNQGQSRGKGKPPVSRQIPGLFDVFVFDAHDPAAMMRDFAAITGPAAMPPRWALGYMQSHRTIEDENQILGIVDTFRARKIPVDAVIYLGTGFAPRGWNTTQPSFDFNPDVFKRDPKTVIDDFHAKHVKVVVHIVPFDRAKLPTLRGSIPPKKTDTVDAGHIQTYWNMHLGLVNAGIDAFWPDEGDWFNLDERLARARMYYEGPLSTTPNVRPWSLSRNGYPGIAQYGSWVWSGDTESSWKTLEGQIADGLNYSLSIGPFWGSDIGGFYPNPELTGELYARWFQFASFTPSFRGHGRTWWLRLPWGWGQSDMGPKEGNATALASELNNPNIEPIARKYDDLRYQLLPYTYTLAYEARATGLPLMRAMWLEYPRDTRARNIATQYLWGRDLLIAPVFQKGATSRDVYLPDGTWYDWWSSDRAQGGRVVTRSVDLATMPIYVRAGAIIPVDPVRQYTAEPVTEPTTLRVYRGANGDFTLYDDDGISQDYLTGKGSWTRLQWNDRARRLTLSPGAPSGAKNVVASRPFDVVLLPDNVTRHVTYTGKAVSVSF